LARAFSKNFADIFLRPLYVLPTIVLATTVCILVFSAGTGYATVDNSTIIFEQPVQWQTIRMRVTAYCPCKKCCGRFADGITACGHEILPGETFVAADREFPFGTEMVIPGYNDSQPVKVLDRGGAIHGNRLDVFFASHEVALQWGVKYLDVKVLSE